MEEREQILKSLAERDIEIDYGSHDVPLEVFADNYDRLVNGHKDDSIEKLRRLFADAFLDEDEYQCDDPEESDVAEVNRLIDEERADYQRQKAEARAIAKLLFLELDREGEASFA